MSVPVARAGNRPDAGSTSVLMVAVVCVVMAATAVMVLGSQALVARAQARVGADQAALAGSMVAREHAASGFADTAAVCAVVAESASHNGVTVVTCRVDGALVRVEAAGGSGLSAGHASATAGPQWAAPP